MKSIPVKPQYLRANVKAGRALGVDRENNMIRGYIMAEEGEFKSRRGVFDSKSLHLIMRLTNEAPNGLKSRLGHPTLSDDGVSKHLGRSFNARLDGKRVRGDLRFDPTAFDTPHGNLADYVMRRFESDPDSISSSLVLTTDEEPQLDAKGHMILDEDGEPLPTIWRPLKLHASDIVDTGDAVDGALSADDWAKALSVGMTPELEKAISFDGAVRLGTQLLDAVFPNQPWEVIESRCKEWLERYKELRFPTPEPVAKPNLEAVSLRLREMQLRAERAKKPVASTPAGR